MNLDEDFEDGREKVSFFFDFMQKRRR